MNIYIYRNNQQYGPYDEFSLQSYVNSGQILLHDKAQAVGENQPRTVRYYLRKAHLKTKIENKGNIFSQLKTIGSELIFPRTTLFSKQFLTDQRFLILALIGLFPMMIMQIPLGGFFVFYEVSLYFSVIWGLFFYDCFKTPQVKLKTTLIVFFFTQISIFIAWGLEIPQLNPFYVFVEASFPLDMLGYIFGVGFTEELFKAIPLLIILYRAKEPQIPQTMVYYGLISGIAFGVWEGVEYQMTVNAEQEYTVSFYLNILRLTSLPFLHACWCGITGYFLSFANLYPKYRRSLYLLAFTIPALIHGLYDTMSSWSVVSLFMVFIGLMLLMVYLKQGVNYQSKLRQ